MRRFLSLLLLVCFAPQALAWRGEGHKIVAELAQRRLDPVVLAEVQRLMAADAAAGLPGIADWADLLRESDPELGKRSVTWHFLNFPHGDCHFQAARDCPNGDCVVAAINRQFLLLSDRSRPDAERLQALKFLVHFVADVHQPLHAGLATDRGGNDVQVSLEGEGTNLHAVWDRKILETRGLAFPAYADLLERQAPLPFDASARSDRPAVEWAQESCRIVNEPDFYPRTHTITQEYLLQQQARAELRLRQAGARLADMINYALARPAPASP